MNIDNSASISELLGKQVMVVQPLGRSWSTWMDKCVGAVGTITETNSYGEVHLDYVNRITNTTDRLWLSLRFVELYTPAPDGDAMARLGK